MSTSVNENNKKISKTIFVYEFTTVFCAVFSVIYSKFSHKVTSNYMTYMFLYPLIGGIGLFSLLKLLKLPIPKRMIYNIYNSGIATLTLGSCIQGIFEIAGTSSKYQAVYYIIGFSFVLFSLVSYFIALIQNKLNVH